MPNDLMTAGTSGSGQTSGGTAQGTQPGQTPQVAAPKSFVRASMEHRESGGYDKTVQIGASDQDLGAIPLPAYGYLRSVSLLIECTGGAGTATFQADAPFNALKNITIAEPNGAVIAQFNSGYDLYLANKYSGYRGWNDPRQMPDYSTNVTGGNFSVLLRIPLEINQRNGLGSLPNQNAAAAFQLRATLSAASTVYGTAPTTLPNVRIRVIMEEWDQPAVSSDGTANSTTPPAMNTTSYWSPQVYPVVAGSNTIRLTRVGNYIRNLLFVYRDTTNARVLNSTGNWADPINLYYDTRPIDNIVAKNWRRTVYERSGYGNGGAVETAGGLDNGVYPYDFCHEFDGSYGMELNDGWLPTLASTRLEIQGSFGVAGTLTVLTNDVSVAGNVFMS